MPRGRPSQRSGDDDVAASQSSQSMSQAEKAAASINKNELERKVNDLVQFLLIMEQKKLPIKRLDINKCVLKEHSKSFPIMIEKARQKLQQVFGYELVELDSKQKSYIIVNKFDGDTENAHLEWQQEDNAKMGLVMVMLSVIFMNNNVISDAAMWATLKKLGVDVDHSHEEFGDVKKLVTQEFVRQGYIEYIKQPTSDTAYEFKWGQRAIRETSKKNVLDFVCQIYGDTNPQQWTSQWQDILKTEGAYNDEGAVIVE